jgi:NAD-dependent dihydropyrimidine dehydrogenase PreA subunit
MPRPEELALALRRRAAADPDRPGERCAAPAGTWAPVVDHSRCESQEDCVTVCPHDVFEVTKIEADDWRALGLFAKLRVAAHGRTSAYAVNAERCQACGLCVVACPEQAITLRAPSG